jgi:hypothetical protein
MILIFPLEKLAFLPGYMQFLFLFHPPGMIAGRKADGSEHNKKVYGGPVVKINSSHRAGLWFKRPGESESG